MQAEHTPRVLSIAGSDSGGGAGIQADLKAFAACGVHGMTAITAITAQNTTGVDAIQPVAPKVIVAQVKAVAGDIGVDAVKIGMLGDTATIGAVVEALDLLPAGTPVVLDPVMISESGARLLDEAAVEALRDEIVTRATVATPNLPEARVLADQEADAGTLARAIVGRGRPGRRRHRRPRPRRDRRVLRRRPARAHTGRAPRGRRGPRLGLHALVGPGSEPRPWRNPPASGPNRP